ncbi:MAG TPA: tRNA (adenosine(37)-N6)-dimethylallyltransferase MiaA [Dehalococcoidia bacterium]|nr:tRNA (adenosine(37)-N6)-dimethylallyltransferase MiaA [Dehalococcoidia bacterium]
MSLLVAVVGPTAAGKTRLAIALAQRFSGEIINADSRQVYRYMDIGTAKPTLQEQQQAPHHLLDIRDPDQDFALGAFLVLAKEAIKDIRSRQHLPILAGGTGQYIWALIEGWDVPQVPPDEGFRRLKEQEVRERGGQALYEELQRIDPQRASELDPRNVRRVIRALEIYHATQRRPSDYGKRISQGGNPLIIGLTLPREDLYQRIDQRVDKMVQAGLLEEVKNIAGMGYQPGQGPLDSPGYRELGQHLNGEITLEEAVQRTKFQTHQLARRQYTWFKRSDPRIRWLDAADPQLDEKAAQLVTDFYSRSRPVLQ